MRSGLERTPLFLPSSLQSLCAALHRIALRYMYRTQIETSSLQKCFVSASCMHAHTWLCPMLHYIFAAMTARKVAMTARKVAMTALKI